MIPALACAFATHIGFSVLLNRLHALIVVRIVFWAATWRHYVIVSTSIVDGNTPSVFASAVLAGVSLQDSLAVVSSVELRDVLGSSLIYSVGI